MELWRSSQDARVNLNHHKGYRTNRFIALVCLKETDNFWQIAVSFSNIWISHYRFWRLQFFVSPLTFVGAFKTLRRAKRKIFMPQLRVQFKLLFHASVDLSLTECWLVDDKRSSLKCQTAWRYEKIHSICS